MEKILEKKMRTMRLEMINEFKNKSDYQLTERPLGPDSETESESAFSVEPVVAENKNISNPKLDSETVSIPKAPTPEPEKKINESDSDSLKSAKFGFESEDENKLINEFKSLYESKKWRKHPNFHVCNYCENEFDKLENYNRTMHYSHDAYERKFERYKKENERKIKYLKWENKFLKSKLREKNTNITINNNTMVINSNIEKEKDDFEDSDESKCVSKDCCISLIIPPKELELRQKITRMQHELWYYMNGKDIRAQNCLEDEEEKPKKVKTGGRKKGTPNKKTLEKLKAINNTNTNI